MSDQVIPITPGAGANVDVSELTVSAKTVERQRINLADPTDPSGLAKVLNSAPVGTEYGLVVRQSGALALPTGAATSAKQPALGTAGAASADVISVQGIAGGTSLPVTQGEGYAVFTATAVTAIALLDCGDCVAYNWAEVHVITNAGADTVTFQVSNDGTNYVGCALVSSVATQSQPVLTTTTTGMWCGPILGRYLKLIKNAAVNAVTVTVVVKQTVGIAQTLGGTVQITPASSAGNADTFFRLNSAASINATTLKNSSAILKSFRAFNTASSARYLKFYNKGSSIPAPASDAALLVDVVRLAATTGAEAFNYGTYGLGCASGLGIAITTGVSDTDATAVSAGDVLLAIGYK